MLERDAASVVQWEFSDRSTDGADLGYTYGQPFITRLANNKWVVLVPGSYNSNVADGAAGSGNAVLYVLDAQNGAVLKKFDLGAIDSNARGLAAPVAIDLQNDDIAEMAYAGDLAGNIWRFDLTATNARGWSASKLYAPATAFQRPITAQPRAERHPDTKQPMVFVGTGKYIEKDDRTTSIPAQAFSGGLLDGKSTRRFSFGEHALQEENDDAVVLRQALHDPVALAPVIVTDASGRLHLHEDPAANLVLITDDNGTPAERYQYDAFGDPTILNGGGDIVLPASAVDQGPRFGSMPYLGGPGLFAAGARHYDPITGVFLARDPNLHSDSPSPYAYCGHNPVGRIDPDGALWGPLLFGVFGFPQTLAVRADAADVAGQ